MSLAVAAFFLLGVSYGAQVIDYVLTQKALDKGFVEVGPINGPVVKKWGKNALPLATFIEAVVVTVLAAVFGTLGMEYLVAFAGPLAAVQVYQDLKDLKTLGKL